MSRSGAPRAVAYLRMSTDMQPGSLGAQAAVIEAYAHQRGYQIMRSYEDAAISGVDARKRPAFRQLLSTVLSGGADFEVILVYDVSRWGRFQDPDEAAHYEFLCSQEGVRIEYCAEAFGAGAAAGDVLMKALKRAMASEYSRELSQKVRGAQRRYAAAGFWQNGEPGYGLARQVVDLQGRPVRRLERGERNALRDQRTTLAAGPPQEVAVVRRMFRLCGDEDAAPGQIAGILNAEGVPSPGGRRWSAERVRAILTNPKYAGDVVTQTRTTPLGGRRQAAAPETWVVARGASPALVPRRLFARVQSALEVTPPPSDAALLEALRPIAEVYGQVSEPRLKALGAAFHRSYRHRFGSLRAAFALVGAAPAKHFPKKMDEEAMLRGLARLFLREGDLSPRLIDADPGLPSADHYRRRFGGLATAYAKIGFVRITQGEARSALGARSGAAGSARSPDPSMGLWGARRPLQPHLGLSRRPSPQKSRGSNRKGSLATSLSRAAAGWRGLIRALLSCGTTALGTFSTSAAPRIRKSSPTAWGSDGSSASSSSGASSGTSTPSSM